jgi:3-phosphoshikimate 1-carboxyvinyltransferase
VTARAVVPLAGPLDAVVRVPGSKSLTNRALVCAALAAGTSSLDGVLFADDTEAMLEGLERLGIAVTADRPSSQVTVVGCGGELPAGADGATLDARLSGTTSRFLLPLLALGSPSSSVRLDGAAPLRTRPMADGIAALRALDVEVVEEGEPGHLPVVVRGRPRSSATATATTATATAAATPVLTVAGDASSQFLSGLLLSAPALPAGLRLDVTGDLVSRPYVDMTVAVMAAFGAEVGSAAAGSPSWTVAGTGYRATRYAVEPDASTASYFFAAAAIVGGRVTVAGLGRGSLQGDLGFVGVLAQMGCRVEQTASSTTVTGPAPGGGGLVGVDVDLRDLSDTAPSLAVVAAFARTPTRLRGIGFIRRKESDRIGDVIRELGRCGIAADEEPDGLVVHPGVPQPARLATYDDHRLAMSFALLGLRAPGIEIADPAVVTKTFPGYWEALDALREPPPGSTRVNGS